MQYEYTINNNIIIYKWMSISMKYYNIKLALKYVANRSRPWHFPVIELHYFCVLEYFYHKLIIILYIIHAFKLYLFFVNLQ